MTAPIVIDGWTCEVSPVHSGTLREAISDAIEFAESEGM